MVEATGVTYAIFMMPNVITGSATVTLNVFVVKSSSHPERSQTSKICLPAAIDTFADPNGIFPVESSQLSTLPDLSTVHEQKKVVYATFDHFVCI